MHDAKIYTSPSGSDTFSIGDIGIIEDICKYIRFYSQNVIFYTDSVCEPLIEQLETDARYRPELSFVIAEEVSEGHFVPTNRTVFDKPTAGRTELIHNRITDPRLKIELPGVRLRQRRRFSDDGSAVGRVRDRAWFDVVHDYARSNVISALQPEDFWTFARSHPSFSEVGNWVRPYLAA